ncbi:MAG: hypothetical protein QOK29_1484 [Rhodospirillaceae bacterium]|nr:hypothetical protein [Rhodospirillaceae bacterium]
MSDHPTHEWPDAEAEHQEARPGADRARAHCFRGGLRHGGERAGNSKRGAEPLECAGRDDHAAVRRQRDDQRGEREQCDPGGRGAPRPEPVRRLAAQNDERGGSQQVGIDHPFHCRGTKTEAARHRGQRGHDRRAVFANRKDRQVTGDKHKPVIARH